MSFETVKLDGLVVLPEARPNDVSSFHRLVPLIHAHPLISEPAHTEVIKPPQPSGNVQ